MALMNILKVKEECTSSQQHMQESMYKFIYSQFLLQLRVSSINLLGRGIVSDGC